jgi:hypothetical protein
MNRIKAKSQKAVDGGLKSMKKEPAHHPGTIKAHVFLLGQKIYFSRNSFRAYLLFVGVCLYVRIYPD